jgi:hypothetical protein
LAALAYAGAGGNLNLAQSLYIKEKGYGMAKEAGHITNILAKGNEDIHLEGANFSSTPENIQRFNIWWDRINLEHMIVFLATGAFTMMLLSLLAYATVYQDPEVATSINFVLHEAIIIAQNTFPLLGTFFLVMAGIMLFGTQFSVYGSNARIATENLVIIDRKKFSPNKSSKFFFGFLWVQIAAGILILLLGFTEPLALVITGAVLNAFSMFIYTGLILWMNMTSLEKHARPSFSRTVAVFCAFLFYGGFSIFTIVQNIF